MNVDGVTHTHTYTFSPINIMIYGFMDLVLNKILFNFSLSFYKNGVLLVGLGPIKHIIFGICGDK